MARRRKGHRKPRLPAVIWVLLLVLTVSVLVVSCQRLAAQTGREETQSSEAQSSKQAFIQRLAPYAQELQTTYGILPSITLAQAILESNWGQSSLAVDYHNLFGIKSNDPKASQVMTTKEYVNGKWETVNARFAVYPSDQASMKAHALLFVNGTRWNAAQYRDVVAAKTYQEAAKALQTDGYATDPDYPSKLIALIKTWHLDRYDTTNN
ncbi:glycoside hydrolase family 73 protein [Lacticaseibacillus sp. GG6-2]